MEIQDLVQALPADFAPASRVWVYQNNRRFGLGEALSLEPVLEGFVQQWNSHGDAVKGYANLFYGQFIVLMADETQTGVSGCSTDSSVRLIRQIEQDYRVNLFDRLSIAFLKNDKIEMLPLSQLKYAVENGFITPETMYFNTLVRNKAELETQFLIPAGESWLKKYFS